MPDFTQRSMAMEIMDDLSCKGEVVEQTLRELDVINKWLGGDRVTLDGVANLMKMIPLDQPVIIADLGCGSGELLAKILAFAKQQNRNVKLIGIDANPNIIEYAKRHHPHDGFEFLTMDIFSAAFAAMQFDIVIGTLFFHHFSNPQITGFLQQVRKQVKVGIIVNDIHRHPFAYYSIKWLTAIFSKSAMVKFDAPLSVLRAFTRKDWDQIIGETGLSYSLKWKWAFRWQLIIPAF